MAYSISINGTDRTADVIAQSVVIDDIINDQVNTCSFDVIDRSGTGTPATDQEVIITMADSTRIFAGYITSIGMSKKTTGAVLIRIKCADYTRLLDRNLVHDAYESMTDAAIIADIINTYCPGFGVTGTNVVLGVSINQIKFNYIQPSQALRKMCELTGRNWYIDYYKDIHYFPMVTNAAPFNLTDAGGSLVVYINEPMTSAPSGTLAGNATYVPSTHLRLTQAVNGQYGSLVYTAALGATFTAELDIWSGSGNGADGVWFFWGCSSIPTAEDIGVGYGGYLVAYDEYEDQIQLWFDGTKLTSVAQSGLDNAATRLAKVVVNGNNIKVYLDGSVVIDYNDTTRALGGQKYGVAARTGGLNNEHRLSRLYVYTPATSIASDYTGLQISKDATQLKNRVYVRGGTKLSDSTTYSVKGDGVAKKFPIPDKPHNVSLTVNGASKTIGIKNIDTSGFDWYLNFEEKYIEQDAGGSTLSTSDTLVLTYQYDIPILVAVEDTASINISGPKEYAIFDKSIATTQAARDRASAELTDYANSLVEGQFRTHTPGFRSGQYININLAAYGINANYLVQKVTAHALGAGLFYYDISIASAKTLGIIKFLIQMLEANKNLIELDDDEVIDELLSVQDSLLSDSLTEVLTIDSTGANFTWCTDSVQSTPITRARWELFQWG